MNPAMTAEAPPPRLETAIEGDLAYQDRALEGVSRTFALTIPQLPDGLRPVVGNAYLLCRIADTIEDCEVLTFEEKRAFYRMFIDVVNGAAPAAPFAEKLAPRLGGAILAAERDLVRNTPAVIRVTHSFGPEERAALGRCIRIMSEGMERFQHPPPERGLRDQRELDSYCYYVAGVVGEMLTELFCAHSEAAAARREDLSALAVSFGQGLQMTNILKDVWDDHERRVCWLPRGVFSEEGFDLSRLPEGPGSRAYEAGLTRLIGTARTHLENALAYTLLIPKSEQGIRQFCLWALGMAVLTLRKIHKRKDFRDASEVKISRRSVRATILLSRLAGRNDWALRLLFRLATRRLPRTAGAAPNGGAD